jgi:hypothetical protein
MSFKLNKEGLLKSATCPPGLTKFTLVVVEEPYVSKKGATVQKCDFESEKGYTVSVWFNSAVMGNLYEFVEAADDAKFDPTKMGEIDLNLKEYIGKEVVGSVSHRKDDNGKVQAQIDNFYTVDKVPF